MGVEVVLLTPVPSLGEGLGAMPRFRAEVGPFIGMAGSLNLRYLDGGFTGLESGGGVVGGADLSLRVGYGIEGVIGEEGDGLVYLSMGYSGDTPSSNKFTEAIASAQDAGSFTTAIPGRTGFSARLRMPFYLIPGDLLLLSPLYLVMPTNYERMAVTAANGGLIPWQLGRATDSADFSSCWGARSVRPSMGWHQTIVCWRRAYSPGAGPRVINSSRRTSTSPFSSTVRIAHSIRPRPPS